MKPNIDLDLYELKNFQKTIFGTTIEEYIEKTIITKNKEEVDRYLNYYLWKMERSGLIMNKDVHELLTFIMEQEEIKQKIQIVLSASWRKDYLIIRPNKILTAKKNRFRNYFEYLHHLKDNASVIFVVLRNRPGEKETNQTELISKAQEEAREMLLEKEIWRKQFNTVKREKINDLLDAYNDYKLLQEMFPEETYTSEIGQILVDLKKWTI